MRADDDPMSDTAPAVPRPPAGGCDKCDHGWVVVGKDENGMFLTNHPEQPDVAELVASTEVYPCPDCDPARFLELTSGCFNRHHTGCDRCAYRRPKSRSHT